MYLSYKSYTLSFNYETVWFTSSDNIQSRDAFLHTFQMPTILCVSKRVRAFFLPLPDRPMAELLSSCLLITPSALHPPLFYLFLPVVSPFSLAAHAVMSTNREGFVLWGRRRRLVCIWVCEFVCEHGCVRMCVLVVVVVGGSGVRSVSLHF